MPLSIVMALLSHFIISTAFSQQVTLPIVELEIDNIRILAEVADDPKERQIGYQARPMIPAGSGMLFIFPTPQQLCFWMDKTVVPLDALFIDDDGTITKIVTMEPLSRKTHCSDQQLRYVLELPAGWLARQEVKSEAKVTGGPFEELD